MHGFKAGQQLGSRYVAGELPGHAREASIWQERDETLDSIPAERQHCIARDKAQRIKLFWLKDLRPELRTQLEVLISAADTRNRERSAASTPGEVDRPDHDRPTGNSSSATAEEIGRA